MANANKFNGAIGAWIDSELHPAGATAPSSPNSDFTSMKLNNVYKSLDYLCIAWFGVDTSNPDQPTISTTNPGLSMIVNDARTQQPDITLFATLAYTNQITQDLITIIENPAKLKAFAANIATYLGQNQLNGFDIDWETPTSDLSQSQCAAWLNAMGQAFGSNYYISLSPATTEGLDATAVNNNCSIVNLQTYSGFTFANQFVDIGINPSLLGFGAKFETAGNGDPNPFQNAYQAYQEYQAGFNAKGNTYPYATIINWRLDSNNWAFEQGQQLLLEQYIKGAPYTLSFDDSAIINAQTTPTLISSVTLWSGEVVDAIQAANQNQDGSYVVEMLQHGGDTGVQNPTISLPDGLTAFSYVTGNWYGNQVVAQVTINGQSFPSAVSSSVSNTQTTTVSAPSGKTVVAFSGSLLKVQLAGGGFTWVLSALDGVFG